MKVLDNKFISSVDNYSFPNSNDLENSRRKKTFRSLLFRSLIIALCFGLLGYSLYMILAKFLNNYYSESAYDEIRVDVDSKTGAVAKVSDMLEPTRMLTVNEFLDAGGEYEDYIGEKETVTESDMIRCKRIYKNYINKSREYPNMYAWIYMTDTNINYPVMKCDDNYYYLNHNYNDEEFKAGSIFADKNTADNYYSNFNILIYGHNMKNGSMFRSLKIWCGNAGSRNLTNKSKIEIYTPEGVYVYDILSYYIDDQFSYAKTSFKDADDYLSYISQISKKSYVKTKRDFSPESRICTLITCTNGYDGDSRYVVHGILSKFYAF